MTELPMSLEFYLAYVLACVVVVIVPGPTVSLIVANSVTHGTRAGLINIAGTQLGLAVMIGIVLIGLASLIATMGVWFDWVRLAGAAYLIWLGFKFLRSPGALGDPARIPAPRMGFFWQGFLVLMSNPKALLLFGAFIPHSAVRRSQRGLHPPSAASWRDRHGGRRHFRQRLCGAYGTRPHVAVAGARAAGLAAERRLPHWRRRVARPGADAVRGSASGAERSRCG
jgi:LysE type translocator